MKTTQDVNQSKAISNWREATEAVNAAAQRATTTDISQEMFEDIKDLRAFERDAWKRCREFLSEL